MDLKDFITFIILDFIKPAMWLIMSLAVVYFLWSITQVIINSDNMDQREELKKRATWGIVALFVMTSMWGLVNILINTFQPSTQLNQVPFVPGGGGAQNVSNSSSNIFAPTPTPQQTVIPGSGTTNPLFQPTPMYPSTAVPR